MSDLLCRDERRRGQVRKATLNGLDYLEVGPDHRTLTVYFLGQAPEHIAKGNVRITGGRRIRGIEVVDLAVYRQEAPERDDSMVVIVDRAGDASTYSLCVVALDAEGKPTGEPLAGFDRRYACLDFSFMAGCPTDLDCKQDPVCPPPARPEPDINYLAKDYASFRQLILDRLALIMPDWRERHVPDLGITLVELLAYVGDHASYYQDAVATEAYLDTARERISVRRHARLVDYPLHEGCNARAWMALEVAQTELPLSYGGFYFIAALDTPSGPMLTEEELPRDVSLLVFEPMAEAGRQEVILRSARNEIRIYTWGDAECCLPTGAITAVLLDPGTDHTLKLEAFDVLIFEEVKGPKTGNPADADPRHRHAVRLIKATPDVDPLTGAFIWDVEWAQEDALPFPVCVSSIGPAPDCEAIPDVSVVRGNVILADHGRRTEDDLGQVPTVTIRPECGDPCVLREVQTVAGPYAPRLRYPEITFAEPLPPCRAQRRGGRERITPASTLLGQDPRKAMPQVELYGIPSAPDGVSAFAPDDPRYSERLAALQQTWVPRGDLLGSGPDDRHFVVEIDDEGRGHIRFGDGESGRRPDAGLSFRSAYRVGNGPAGNVGAEAIDRIVFRSGLPSGAGLRVRNPLPAAGGIAPEAIARAKLRIPHAFRSALQRAVTPADYAAIVMRDFAATVQRAAAALRWTGGGPEVLVAVDPLARAQGNDDLLGEIGRHLERFRRIGHDVRVTWAHQVALDIAVTVCVLPSYLRGHVKAAVLDALSARTLPDGRRGFFHPDRLTFGEGIYLSKLVAEVQGIPGVESVRVDRLERLYEGPNGEIDAGVLLLGPLEVARLDSNPSFPEHGVLTLKMGGGR